MPAQAGIQYPATPVLVADPTAAFEALMFRPKFSDLATIVRTAWGWHQKAHPMKGPEVRAHERAPSLSDAPGAGAVARSCHFGGIDRRSRERRNWAPAIGVRSELTQVTGCEV
jgi:hypothetical protein